MNIQRISAFSHNNQGGNPAGVVICNPMPSESEMLNIAKEVGYSETAFLQKINEGWRVRYFAPEMEVPFCGHATIASGAALGEYSGEGEYQLFLNDGSINIQVSKQNSDSFKVTLTSPNTWSKEAPSDYSQEILNEFNLTDEDLDDRYPIRFAFAGAKHLIIVLKTRKRLAEMSYHFERLKALMQNEDLVTINLLYAESNQQFHSRNPFPTGGVYEDPATGAAAAAFAGYLRDINWQGDHTFSISQGVDMGSPSHLLVEYSDIKGEGINVTGNTRNII